MNYTWELAVRAKEQGMDLADVHFLKAEEFSPYMELSFPDMNQREIGTAVEINPFYRYYSIFKELFHPDMEENPQIVQVLFDLAIHHLADIDVMMGMNRQEYYTQFMIRDLQNGYFGAYITKRIGVFNPMEMQILANNVLELYSTGEGIYLLKKTMAQIFTSTYIFSNAKERDEIIFFLRIPYSLEKEMKISVMKYLFLPFKCNVEVYWERIFGVMGVDDLMKIGQMVLY